MRLTRLFFFTSFLLVTLVSSMMARSVLQDWRTVRAAQRGLDAMELTYLAMKAAEKCSAERGPTVAILGDAGKPVPSRLDRLQSARQASDEAMVAVTRALSQSTAQQHQAATRQIQDATGQLAKARLTVDAVLAMPLTERAANDGAMTRQPIREMFAVIDTLLEAVTVLSSDAEKAYPELSLSLAGARLAAELRENAGRLGSQFTAALASHGPLGAQELRDIPVLRGRIEQLQRLIEVQARANPSAASVAQAVETVNKRYMGVGLALIDGLTQAGMSAGLTKASLANPDLTQASQTGSAYGMDSTQFVARYVPEMTTIVALRDSMFEVARAAARRSYATAKNNLIVNAAIGLAVILLEVMVLWLIQKRLLQPLLANTRAVVAIANGQLDTQAVTTPRQDEIGQLQNAVAALKVTSQQKQDLQTEREHLIEQLRITSSTDYLTGLFNRTEFSDRIEQQWALARRQGWNVTLVVFDIDHFKSVNDRFGHTAGDAVLKQVAQAAKRNFRIADTLVRYGGEEFVALMLDCNAADAAVLVERVRADIAATAFSIPDHSAIRVTASFGIFSTLATDELTCTQAFEHADRAMYQAKSDGRNCVVIGPGTLCIAPRGP